MYVMLRRVYFETATHRFITAEARVRLQDHTSGIYGGSSGTWRGFSQSTSVFPIRYNSTDCW